MVVIPSNFLTCIRGFRVAHGLFPSGLLLSCHRRGFRLLLSGPRGNRWRVALCRAWDWTHEPDRGYVCLVLGSSRQIVLEANEKRGVSRIDTPPSTGIGTGRGVSERGSLRVSRPYRQCKDRQDTSSTSRCVVFVSSALLICICRANSRFFSCSEVQFSSIKTVVRNNALDSWVTSWFNLTSQICQSALGGVG